jgi:hypothetical protein
MALAGGCGAGSETLEPASAPVTPPASTATPAPQPAAAQPETWRSVGDVDGDGKPDLARVVDTHRLSGDELRAERYRLDLRSSSLGLQTVDFGGDIEATDGSETDPNRVLGGADIDGDGSNEVFVQIGHGASTAFDAIFRVWHSRITRVTLDGQPTELASGGSVGSLGWFGCTPPLFTVSGAGATPNWKAYVETTDRYRLAGTALVLVSHRSRRVAEPDDGDSPLCAGLGDG